MSESPKAPKLNIHFYFVKICCHLYYSEYNYNLMFLNAVRYYEIVFFMPNITMICAILVFVILLLYSCYKLIRFRI